jgi:uncharacterized membrane protein YfcA
MSFFAGIFNTMAAGGSFLMLPLLIFAGLPPTVANGTNRVALLAQNAASQYGFIKQGVSDLKTNIRLSVPAVIGSTIGAYLSVRIPEVAFKKILSALMIIFVILMIFKENNKRNNKQLSYKPNSIVTFFIFFLVGLYGGFIQAGVGLFLIGSIKFCTNFDLIKTNSVKTFIIACYTVVAILIFAFNGKINWNVALLVAVGQGLGGYAGSKIAVKGGEKFVKKFIIAAIILMAVKLFLT